MILSSVTISTIILASTIGQGACFNSPKSYFTSKSYVQTVNRVTAAKSPLFMVLKDKQDEKVLESEIKEKLINGEVTPNGSGLMNSFNLINGERLIANTNSSASSSVDILGLVDEINDEIMAGSDQLFQNMTETLEDKLESVIPNSSNGVNPDTLSKLLTEMTRDIQKAQQNEIRRQLDLMERKLVRPFEDFAFNDAALLTPGEGMVQNEKILSVEEAKREKEEHRRELVIAGANSTLADSSRTLRTKEILKNLNVAPFYYSVTLLLRWCRKLSAPPLAVLTVLKGAGSMLPGGTQKSYNQVIEDGEQMQQGWKRTGEIAAKGAWSRKLAILRRSLEIWAYFSSFYIKEKRMTKMFDSGRWSPEKFSEERSKLGAEITQNLLKLGPTFIKVRNGTCRTAQIHISQLSYSRTYY